ncbi:MAG: peptide-methionine (R)-S-oxide reductase MsrB [Pseudomonadota bacterium]
MDMIKIARPVSRRGLLIGSAATALVACSSRSEAGADQTDPVSAGTAEFSDSDWRTLTDAEWRERLSDKAYYVLREDGTERAFTSPLNAEKRSGTFHCAGCDLPLFKSETKYDSGTGWPSFFDVIEGAVGTKPDNKLWMTRTEYHCARCLGHQGHVFEDGPAPTGLRYCNNGVALTFKPSSA